MKEYSDQQMIEGFKYLMDKRERMKTAHEELLEKYRSKIDSREGPADLREVLADLQGLYDKCYLLK